MSPSAADPLATRPVPHGHTGIVRAAPVEGRTTIRRVAGIAADDGRGMQIGGYFRLAVRMIVVQGNRELCRCACAGTECAARARNSPPPR